MTKANPTPEFSLEEIVRLLDVRQQIPEVMRPGLAAWLRTDPRLAEQLERLEAAVHREGQAASRRAVACRCGGGYREVAAGPEFDPWAGPIPGSRARDTGLVPAAASTVYTGSPRAGPATDTGARSRRQTAARRAGGGSYW